MYNLYFDFTAIFGFAAMIFAVIFKRTSTTTQGRFFLMMLIVGFLSAVFDIVSVTPEAGEMPVYIANVAYLSCRSFAAFSFCMYMIGITDNWHKVKGNFLLFLLLILPLFTVFGFLVANYWNGWVFTVVEGVYHRGILINNGFMYWVTLVYMVVAFVFVIKYRSFFSRDKIAAIVFIYPCALVALLIQMFFSSILVEVFFTCIAYFVVMIMVERPEEVFEPEIGLRKYTAFSMDMNKALVTNKAVNIIFIHIVNENSIASQLNYAEQITVRKTVGGIIKDTAADFSLKGNFYWLGQGQYAAMLIDDNQENAVGFATTVRRRLNVPVKCSFGIVDLYGNAALMHCPTDVQSREMCLTFMDNFYHIHSVLKGVFDLSDITDKHEFEIKLNMEYIIKRAFLDKNFEVYFQPIYSVKEKTFTAAEALIRLTDPQYGSITPEVFIPEAERSGAIHKIGDFVFDRVCRFISSKEFESTGLEFIEVNLSVAQLMHEDLPIHIMDILRKYNVSPRKICLEIRETSDAYSHKMMEDNIHTLKELGFSFTLDDYGTGYSSIDNVSKLPLDAMKLDKDLVNTQDNPELRTILENSIRLIRDMKRKIVVEGVENEESFNLFESFLCDYIQGFYFSKPLPEAELMEFLRANSTKAKDETA